VPCLTPGWPRACARGDTVETLSQRRLDRAELIDHDRRFTRKIMGPNGSEGQWKNVPSNIHYLLPDGERRPRATEFGQCPASSHRWS